MKNPIECKHLGDWWSCEKSVEIVGSEEWLLECDYYPHCENCPDYGPKEKKDNENT